MSDKTESNTSEPAQQSWDDALTAVYGWLEALDAAVSRELDAKDERIAELERQLKGPSDEN